MTLKKAGAAGCCAAFFFVAGVSVFALCVCAAVVWGAGRILDGASGGDDFIEEFHSGSAGAETNKIVRIELTGEIGPGGGGGLGGLLDGILPPKNSGGMGLFVNAQTRIRLATDDDSVRGLLLYIDSPGGTLTESDLLWHEVTRFKQSRKDRFVLAHAGGQCCSGGYYVAAAADYILALPTGEVGSIGVISDYGVNVSALAERLGVTSMVVATGPNKDMFNAFKPVPAAQEKIETDLLALQHARFALIVSEARHLEGAALRELTDGRVYGAFLAKQKGLVDGIGYEDDALFKLEEMAGGPVRVVTYEAPEESWLSRLARGARNGARPRACGGVRRITKARRMQ